MRRVRISQMLVSSGVHRSTEQQQHNFICSVLSFRSIQSHSRVAFTYSSFIVKWNLIVLVLVHTSKWKYTNNEKANNNINNNFGLISEFVWFASNRLLSLSSLSSLFVCTVHTFISFGPVLLRIRLYINFAFGWHTLNCALTHMHIMRWACVCSCECLPIACTWQDIMDTEWE